METLKQFIRRHHAEQTASSYLYKIDVFLMRNPNAKNYLYSDIINYLTEQRKNTSNQNALSPRFSTIKRYYDYLVHTGQRDDHPCRTINLRRKNRPIQIQDLFTSNELEALLNRENRYKDLELKNKVTISFLIYQGLAPSEICRLQLENVDLDEATIYVKGSRKNSARRLSLKSNQIMMLQKYIETSRKQLLKIKSKRLMITKGGGEDRVDGIHNMITMLKPLYPDRVLNPSTIRQSVISNLLNEKKIPLEDVQLFAGHKYPSSTEKYRRKDINEQRVLINKYHPLR